MKKIIIYLFSIIVGLYSISFALGFDEECASEARVSSVTIRYKQVEIAPCFDSNSSQSVIEKAKKVFEELMQMCPKAMNSRYPIKPRNC